MYDADCLEKIGSNVKFLRTMRKLRQQDVAEKLGISQTHLSNMECGRVKYSLKHLLRLANLFNCQLECFFDPHRSRRSHLSNFVYLLLIMHLVFSVCC